MWINEIESAKSIANLKASYTIAGAKLQTDFRGSRRKKKKASGLKKIMNGDLQRKVPIQEDRKKLSNGESNSHG